MEATRAAFAGIDVDEPDLRRLTARARGGDIRHARLLYDYINNGVADYNTVAQHACTPSVHVLVELILERRWDSGLHLCTAAPASEI